MQNHGKILTIWNQKGQVAIFIALIFQVLFLFFAMVVNVGLLVHHKINLQNSVDLAAYYGAMKQAENMNAISHVNYQIRQSWKLLTWRYRVIGSAGEDEFGDGRAQPFIKDPKKNPNPVDADVDKINPKMQDFYEAPSFCITYVPFKPMPKDENTCRQMATHSGVKLFKPPAVIAGFLGFTHTIQAASEAMKEKALDQCKIMGSWNYFMLGKFVVSYNMDQADRMATINKIARATSHSTDDFYDVDGDSVRQGIEKTLNNNLTYANKEGDLQFEVFNSLGTSECNGGSVPDTRPPRWLNTVNIVPAFNYIDTYCEDNIDTMGKELVGASQINSSCSNYKGGSCGPHYRQKVSFREDIRAMSQYIGPRSDPNNLNNLTLGVEKNPWCMAYVGVKATAKPNIPFSPFGSVTLHAKAFAKPFGGRVGPWYYKKWPRGYESIGSDKSEQTDELLPRRANDPAYFSDASKAKERIVNYSRFIGDTFGLMSRMVLGYGARAIYRMDPQWNAGASSQVILQSNNSPTFSHWDHLPFNFTGNGKNGDVLSWGGSADRSPMRDLELAAILPDPFDYSYYSIEPNFYHNYYLRLKNGLLAKRGALPAPQILRPDIGARIGESNLESFSVKDQVRYVKGKVSAYPLDNYKINDRQTYLSLNWQNALTGWSAESLIDYSINKERFGRCLFPANVNDVPYLDPPTSGNCAGGGTTGYSVKLIASDYLKKQDLQLGGESTGAGSLFNPPPEGW